MNAIPAFGKLLTASKRLVGVDPTGVETDNASLLTPGVWKPHLHTTCITMSNSKQHTMQRPLETMLSNFARMAANSTPAAKEEAQRLLLSRGVDIDRVAKENAALKIQVD